MGVKSALQLLQLSHNTMGDDTCSTVVGVASSFSCGTPVTSFESSVAFRFNECSPTALNPEIMCLSLKELSHNCLISDGKMFIFSHSQLFQNYCSNTASVDKIYQHPTPLGCTMCIKFGGRHMKPCHVNQF